jgi:light-regulated signal transduction histidine kinase (bacteriophytochrome)
VNGQFVIGGASRADQYASCPPGAEFRIEKGGIYMDLIKARGSLRLTDEEVRTHPAWWGLPKGHVPLRGFLGASLFDDEGQPNGIIIVSDKEGGADFTVEDEDFLVQLASIASLAIQHIQARNAVEQQATELEATNKELEAFSYSVSHDLRAPLRALDGFSEMVIEEYQNKLDEKAQDYLNRVRRASQRMSDLIDDMLKLSQITRADMYRDELNLSRIVQTIIEELQARQHERKVEFIIAPDATADGDLQLISIALRNLLENAWKFTGKCPQPRIQFGTFSKNGERVFYIKDNGAGFDMKDADKLFKAFQRLHTADEYEGTGIGLAIVQRIVRRHGGRIWVEAARGQGATFYFTLA